MNTYNYARSNAINYFDSLGLEPPRGERGATGGTNGKGTNNPNKHCKEFTPPDPRFVECRHHQTGKWDRKPRPTEMPYPDQTANPKPLEFEWPACGEDCQKSMQQVLYLGVFIFIMKCLSPG